MPLQVNREDLSGIRPWPCVARTGDWLEANDVIDERAKHTRAAEVGLAAGAELALLAL